MINKSPTLKQKVQQYEDFLHKINLMIVSGNGDGISELLDNADKWSYSFRNGNGELTEEEQQKLIDKAFWNLSTTPKTDKLIAERQARYSKINR